MKIKLGLLISIISVAISISPQVLAADAHNYNAGRIIDDSVFTNSNTMTIAQIQQFLDSKMPNCDTYGTAGGTYTNRNWIEDNLGISPPYRCVRDYRENPSTGANNYGTWTNPSGSLSSAELIYNYSKQFNINPQVLLVTLQKENGLITDNIPIPRQYQQAMGFGCPDNVAPGQPVCDPAYNSFSNQLYQAARHFRGYIDKPAGWTVTFDTGWNDIMWSPDQPRCGSGSVFIENRSTVALYTYTPYQPNNAAKDAQYGYGDSCSAHGNRNFYLYFTDWFGTTAGSFTTLSTPRYLQTSKETRKVDPATSSRIDSLIPSGTQIYFKDKIDTAYGTCLRTSHDANLRLRKCIPLNEMGELTIVYNDINTQETTMSTKRALYKQNLRTMADAKEYPLPQARILTLAKKTVIAGTTYFVTAADILNGVESGIPASALAPANTYTPITSTWLRLTSDQQKATGPQAISIDSTIPANTIVPLLSKTTINGVDYYRTSYDTNNNLDKAINFSSLADPYTAFRYPRWMRIGATTTEIDPFTQQKGNALPSGTDVFINSKVVYNGPVYYRSKANTDAGNRLSIPDSNLNEIAYSEFIASRWMLVSTTEKVVDPITGIESGITIPAQSQRKFHAKIKVNNTWYFQDTSGSTVSSSGITEIPYIPFVAPRPLKLSTSTPKITPNTEQPASAAISSGLIVRFAAKIQINGVWYFQTEYDSTYGYNRAIPAAHLVEP